MDNNRNEASSLLTISILFIVVILSVISLAYIISLQQENDNEIFNSHKIADVEFNSPYIDSMAVSNDDSMIIWMERNYKEKKYTIFYSKTDGSDYKKILVSNEQIYNLKFSLDDSKIIYFHDGNSYQMDLNGENKQLFIPDINDLYFLNENEYILLKYTNVSYINDVGNLTYQNHKNLVYYNVQKEEKINLTYYFDRENIETPNYYGDWYVIYNDYNPHQKYILYCLGYDDGAQERRRGKRDDFKEGLYRINIDGTDHNCLLERNGVRRGVFSPDYQEILYQTGAFSHDSPIWIMDADGKNSKQLTNLEKTRNYEGSAFFSGDGKKIIYQNKVTEKFSNLWMMNPDGSGKKMLTSDNAEYRLFLIGPNGKNIYYTKGREPGEIWVMYYE